MRRLISLAPLLLACNSSSSATDAGGAHDVPDVLLDSAADADDAAGKPDVGALPDYVDPYACPMGPGPRPLDESLDASEARAGVVTSASELIGGEAAAGRVGHLRIYNNRVRVIVQGRVAAGTMNRASGYDLYGGNIIDMDVARARGAAGGDVFREMFPAFGYRISDAAEVAVACDGSNGRPAAIRVVGRDVPTRLIGLLDNLARDRDVRIVTHYILRPDSSVLEVRTEVQSNSNNAVPTSVAGEFFGAGSALTLFTDVTGFGDATRAASPPHYLVAVSDPGENNRHVSYAISPATGTMSVPAVDASGTVALYASVSARRGESASFTRYVSIGTGDVSSVVEPLMVARRDPHGVVTGVSSPSALVYAYSAPYAVGAPVRSLARAAADGAYRLALPPGSYALVAVDAGRNRGAPVTVTVADGGTATAAPTVGQTATLVLDLNAVERDGSTTRAPMKVSLRGVEAEAPDRGMGDLEGENEEYGLHRAIYSLGGTERVAVKPGRYRAIVSRGEEYDTVESDVTLTAGADATLAATLHRVLDTPGQVAGDFHQHTVGSIDSGRSLCNRVLEDTAEGLEYAATTDHDNVTDFGPCTRELDLTRWFGSMMGNEISVVGTGHFNAYPLTINPADPTALIGAQYWADQTAQQLFTRIRGEAGNPVLHLSHPRSNNLKGYFTTINLNPFTLAGRTTAGTPVPLATGWEALEVNTEVGNPQDYLAVNDAALRTLATTNAAAVPTMQDWFAFLRRGEHPCALGNSDTHSRNGGSGWPHNLLRVDEDAPGRVTQAMITEAIRAQRVVVASGIVIGVRVNGEARMGWREVVRPGSDGAVPLEITVQAPPWVTARDLTVFENGRPLALARVAGQEAFTATVATAATEAFVQTLDGSSPGRGGAVRWRATVRARPARDSFYVVLARGGSLSPIGAGSAIGYTNPVYVDLDGNGWTPPPAAP
jgi:hypothetical protein